MIIKNGKVLAINSVKHDDTLKGNGLSGTPLGLSETVKQVIESKQNKLSPADNTIAISNDKIKVNTSGISAQQIHPSVFDPYASKTWVNEQGFLKQVALEPYALSADVRREFDASAAWVNDRFEHIPGAEAYYGGNGINVDGHKIDLTADVVSHNELTEALNPYATQEWVEGHGYLTDADLSDFATKEYARQASAAAVSTTQSWVNDQGYLKANALDPYAKTSDVNAQFNATSAWANDKFQVKGDYLTSADLNNYYTKDKVYNKEEIDTLLANFGGFKVVSGDAQQNYAPSLDEHGELSDHTKPNEKTIYLTKVSTLLEDNYKEWIWKGGSIFDCIGIATIDLQGYVTDEELAAELLKYYKKSDVDEMFRVTSAWANETFQPIGEYVSASKLNEYYTKTEVDAEFRETSSWANETFQPIGKYVSATDLDNYYTKSEVNNQFEDLSATVSSEYAKKTDIPEVPVYTAANEYIKITNDYGVSGYDWTDKINTKQDVLTIEQLSAISSVSSVQVVSGNWVTSASDIISAEGLAYFLVKDGDSSKWEGVNLSTLGSSYDVTSEDDTLLHVTTAVDNGDVTYTLSAKDWTTELDEKQDKLTEEQIEAISSVSAIQNTSGNWVTSGIDTISDPALAYVLVRDGNSSKWNGVDLSTLGKTYNVSSVTENLLTVSAKTEDNQTTYILSAADYPEIPEIPDIVGSGLEAEYDDVNNEYLVTMSARGNNGISAAYDDENNVWDIGLSANNFAYMYDSYTNGYVGDVSANTILNFSGTNHNNITVDQDGYIILPETGNKFTFCINEYIDNNNPGTHSYLLNKLTLSSDKGDNLASTMTYYPTEVGASNATLAITIDHSVDPTRKYAVVYEGSTIPLSAYLNATISVVEEVSTLGMINRGESDVYVGDKPINVNNDTRHISLGFDTGIFTLNSNQELTLNANGTGGGDTPVDPVAFNKLLNSINGRIVETIPIGVINYATALNNNYSIAYLFRPMIEFDMTPQTTARFIAGNASAGNSTVMIDVYELNESNYTINLMWWSETKTLTTSKGEQVLNANNGCTQTKTIYPDRLYYARIICTGQQIQQLLGINNTVTEDIGPYDLVYVNDHPDTNPFNLEGRTVNNLGVVGNASFKPYIGFKNT
jgi:hypothetical protein